MRTQTIFSQKLRRMKFPKIRGRRLFNDEECLVIHGDFIRKSNQIIDEILSRKD